MTDQSASGDDSYYTSYDSVCRKRKRRRIEPDGAGEVSDLDDIGGPSQTVFQNSQGSNNAQDAEEGPEKPKSKYKIHVPKNSELPRDAFFTQPPDRSSSPYRIEQFNWQKPSKPPASLPIEIGAGQGSRAKPRNPHVTTSDTNGDMLTPLSNDHAQPREFKVERDEYVMDSDDEDLLAGFPPDALSSPLVVPIKQPKQPIYVSSQQDRHVGLSQQRFVAPLGNLKQTTLFGTQAQAAPSQTQSKRKHNWPMASREEPSTHHAIERSAMGTWVYPTNLGTIRDYQYSIVARGLYHNMLVALPTGLGKTFIAATVMLNWYRWTTSAQIVFVAPTKPLVSQQVKACFEVAGIPRSSTTMLTGTTSPGLRAEEWRNKRVFFMTPQTLINDLKTGICDPKRLVLIVVDEAHRATGGYAYVEVVTFVKRFNSSFRVLALTATPGASIESVQEVIDGLGISRIEIRTEESIDIRQYVHSRKIETVLFDNSDEMVMIMDLFSKALQPVVDKLIGINAYWSRDPMTLTAYGCMQARQRWYASDAGRKAAGSLKGMVMNVFSLLASLAHAIELLKFHGIGPFYHKTLAFRNQLHAGGKKGDKYSNQINNDPNFQTMMSRMQIWINTPDFVGHPKLDYLQSVVMNHFLDAGEGRGASDPSSTRIMVFSHYRDSAEEIARVLKRSEPMIRPHVFVGQSSTKDSEGMDQKTQLEIINKFKSGIYNTLVATSIGEEGLDIGEVDLIICYDASASPIRMLQRMGRTGRKRSGNIVVTLMKGKEENNFTKAKDNYEKMQIEIASGVRFNFHDEESRRIVPKEIQPVADKRVIDIPLENTQAELPEPKKKGRPPKKPPKKFHMPDGVRTGFIKASRLEEEDEDVDDDDNESKMHERRPAKQRRRAASPASIPSLEEVLLTEAEERVFEHKYMDIQGDTSQIVEAPSVDAFPHCQRLLRPTKFVAHSLATRRMVKAIGAMHSTTMSSVNALQTGLSYEDKRVGEAQAKKRAEFFKATRRPREPSDGFEDAIRAPPGSDVMDSGARSDGLNSDQAIAISLSSNELHGAFGLDGFVDDDATEAASSKSSPPPVTSLDQASLRYRGGDSGCDFGSGEELPDFSTLLRNDQGVKSTAHDRRRGGRRVVAEDSDDD